MFDWLIASRSRPDVRRGSSATLASLSLHAALVGGAVYSTLRAAEPPPVSAPRGPVIYFRDSPAPPDPPAVATDVPVRGFKTVDPPAVVPSDLPPLDLSARLDPRDFTGRGAEGGQGDGASPAADPVYVAALVEEPPVLLAGPPLAYPELLRQARVQGRVLVEAVIDTTGRAEAGTVSVLHAAHPGFEAAARGFVLGALFRPARMHGRAVRVLVRLPIEFELRGGG